MEINQNNSILVIQTAFLGDIVLTSSFLRELRQKNLQSRIVLMTTPIGAEILQPNPWNIEFFIYDKHGKEKSELAFYKKLMETRSFQFDTVYCLHRSFRSALISYFSGAKDIIGFRESSGSFLYSEKKVSRKNFLYESEKNLALLNSSNLGFSPQLFCNDEDTNAANDILDDLKEFVLVSPNSVWATKRWPPNYYATIIDWLWQKFQISSVIIGSSSAVDTAICTEIMNLTGEKLAVKNLCGQTGNLGVLKAVISKAKFVISNDSAPLHIATAFSRPVLGIFGPTTKELGFFPHTEASVANVAEIELDCRPCGSHGHQLCPKSHFRCMLDLKPEYVKKLLETSICH